MLIRFKEHEELLCSREGGKIAKDTFRIMFEKASPQNKIVFDFDEVKIISSSFADEFFGKMVAEMGFSQFKSITTFKNVNPFISNVIMNSICHRNVKEFSTV